MRKGWFDLLQNTKSITCSQLGKVDSFRGFAYPENILN